MPTFLDSPSHSRIQTVARGASRHAACRLHLPDEWPYMACSTCLVVLLILHPFDSSSATATRPDASHASQRSLQEIASNCLQDQGRSTVSSAELAEPADIADPRFSRSLLTCRSDSVAPGLYPAHSHMQNRIIQAAPVSRSF